MRTFACCALLALLAIAAPAQTAVDMASEPHHHLLLQNDEVRVFAVTLRPTEQAYIRHEHNFLVVTLQDGEVVVWSEGQSPIQNFHVSQGDVRFFLSGPALGMREDRTTDYRNITVEFLNPKVTSYGYQADKGTWGYDTGGVNPPTDPHARFANSMKLGAAIVRDVQLLPGDSLPPPEREAAELLVPVTDVDLKTQGDRHIRKQPGEVIWIGNGRKSDLLGAGGEPSRFEVVELQLDPK
jgi:hypothetical protein